MESTDNGVETSEGTSGRDANVLRFLDSMDNYLILMDSLSSELRQGWLELASARHSMGASRVNSVLFDLKSHKAATTLQVQKQIEGPNFTLCKWASSDSPEEAKFEEDELLQNMSKSPLGTPHQSELGERRAESGGSPISIDNQAQKERVKSLSIFGKLVSPKLRATQSSFETALEMLVEIANVRASLLCAYNQVQKDLKTVSE